MSSQIKVAILLWSSAFPEAISESSNNQDVQLYVYRILREGDCYSTSQAAWDRARTVTGNGMAILRLRERDWIVQFGIYGYIILGEIKATKYVNIDTTLTYSMI